MVRNRSITVPQSIVSMYQLEEYARPMVGRNEDKNDLRLVFEIERVGQLFDEYKKVKLEIWRTYTDTTMKKIQGLLDKK